MIGLYSCVYRHRQDKKGSVSPRTRMAPVNATVRLLLRVNNNATLADLPSAGKEGAGLLRRPTLQQIALMACLCPELAAVFVLLRALWVRAG